MTRDKLDELFDKHDAEWQKYERVEQPRHNRCDLAAFLLLDALVPSASAMVSAGANEQIFLETDLDALAKVVTEEQIIELIRYGIFVDQDSLSLYL